MTQRSTRSSNSSAQSSGVEPRTTPQESGHQKPRPDERPQADRPPRQPAAETDLGDSGRVHSPHQDSDSDEDARARRRDLGL